MVGVNYGCPKSARPETGKSKRQTNDECRDMRKEMGVRCRSVCVQSTWAPLGQSI